MVDAVRGGTLTHLRAIKLAREAHYGQVDKCGMPFWLHPYRVGVACTGYGLDAMAVGFLHDVVEDTNITLNKLRDLGFSEIVIESVDAISRREKESYRLYILRVTNNAIAKFVKIADLKDNLRDDRLVINKSAKRIKQKQMYNKYLEILQRA